MSAAAVAQEDVAVHAAGSLRAPLAEAARAFECARPGTRLVFAFGASGLLRDRIAGGERADVFITYCTNAAMAVAEQPQLACVPVPADLDVVADYGLTVHDDASPAAQAFADWLLSPAGQAVLARHGFREATR